MFSDQFGDDLFGGRFKHFDKIFENMEEGFGGGGFGGGGGGINIEDLFGDMPGFGGGASSFSFSSSGGRGGGGRGGAGFMSQSSSTSYRNGKKITTISMNKNGKEIKEVYEDDELVERKINGIKQNLDRIEGGGYEEDGGDEAGEDTKVKENNDIRKGRNRNRGYEQPHYAYRANYNLDLGDQTWLVMAFLVLMVGCCYFSCTWMWSLCCGRSTRHEHAQ